MKGQTEIRRLLPHREPILLVDRVHEAEPGVRIVTEKSVTQDELWYAGRYPSLLLAESWAQSAGVLAGLSAPRHGAATLLLGGMKGIEFVADVLAGDAVRHHVRLVRSLQGVALFEGHSEVHGREVMRVASMTMALPGSGGSA